MVEILANSIANEKRSILLGIPIGNDDWSVWVSLLGTFDCETGWEDVYSCLLSSQLYSIVIIEACRAVFWVSTTSCDVTTQLKPWEFKGIKLLKPRSVRGQNLVSRKRLNSAVQYGPIELYEYFE